MGIQVSQSAFIIKSVNKIIEAIFNISTIILILFFLKIKLENLVEVKVLINHFFLTK